MKPTVLAAFVAGLTLVPDQAAAQSLPVISGSIEATTDHRRRGLSWSDGDPALDAYVEAPLIAGLEVNGRATTLRSSQRHDGADAVFDLGGKFSTGFGGITASAGATGHWFAGGASDLDYLELNAGVGALLGPAQLDVTADYAPDQDAIGGDNLYLRARGSVAVIGTPFTVAAHVGHSTGGSDDALRSARLRPTGDYTDWGAVVEYVVGPVIVGARYSGTSIDTDRPAPVLAEIDNSGDRLTAHVALVF
ncbi:TorF family putative porin [Sphingomonas japonica]|uniref:Outer membrane protein beta-barrel domain-containing protein n=1 Tax=Sphingomonas japonica TaxID=511662 RepID=A0ABX0U0K3_9SPHN|nr:TorF family putative porin [Sphingomonas japonica]NIJ23179.1 hypothetical protein [Sphingomonas japonica]